MRKAVFVGSFDPITKGHEDVLLKAMPLFDEIVIGIGHNINKKSFFGVNARVIQYKLKSFFMRFS
ncbi:MAG: adenylyltransferase/cytidyltransferase family protein [Ferruginibacter sp.]|nr:adenylyltransferase/cytidyltransferase family protein [Ferruginibacter sp.]